METVQERIVASRVGGETVALAPQASAVSWGAIIAGAVAGAALFHILSMLGIGLGLLVVSPWAGEGLSAATFGVSAIVWVTFSSLASMALAGYLAGRLRSRWLHTHSDEVYFRDTAHGLLTWALSLVITATLMVAATTTFVAAGTKAAATAAVGAAGAATAVTAEGVQQLSVLDEEGTLNYHIDRLFRGRSGTPASTAANGSDGQGNSFTGDEAAAGEVTRIVKRGLSEESLNSDDVTYLGQLIAERSDLSQAEAERRVREVSSALRTELAEMEKDAKEAADKSRKAGSYSFLWFFVALLGGAFVASFSATCGGRCRDRD